MSIPNGVTSIEAGAFSGCAALTEITIPASVTEIEDLAFKDCTSLNIVHFEGDAPEIGEDSFASDELTAYYPADNDTWTDSVKKDYGGTIIWDHTWDDGEVTKEATCVSTGEKLYTCTVCGETKTEEIPVDPNHHVGGTVIKDAKDATCGAEGYTGDTYCASCNALLEEGKTIAATGKHTWDDGKVTKEPTYEENGEKTFTCTVCGETKTEIIEKLIRPDLKDGTITLSPSSFTYNGKAQTPEVTVQDAQGNPLEEGTDYKVVYANNVNVGTATVTVTGQGNYTGTLKETFKINSASISGATVTLAAISYTYDGTAKKPTVTVKSGSTTLKSGTDYTVSYKNNINVGTATVTVTGKGNYTGTASGKTFKINAASIANASVTGISDKTYTGKAITQSPKVKLGSTTLKSGTDYTVSYKNNTNAGTATVTITGKGNYTGTVNKKFTIKIALAAPQISAIENIAKGTSGIKMNWNKVTGATSYEVYRRKHGTSGWTKIATVTSPTHTDTDVRWMTGTLYDYSIVAVNGSSKSAASPIKTILRMAAPAITGLTNSASKTIKAEWSQNKSADGYQIWYQVGDDASTRKIKTVYGSGTLSTTISGLTGSSYKVFVRSFKAVDGVYYYSAWSASRTVKISSATVYTTKTGSKFHADGCKYLSESKIAISRADAVARGLTPCTVCNP